MKNYADIDYYELLEVPYDASSFEIRQAYKDAFSIYNEDSLATYTFFEDGERDQILKQIEEAFNTLIDERRRTGYDKMLLDEGRIDPEALSKKERNKTVPLFPDDKTAEENHLLKRIRKRIAASSDKDSASDFCSRGRVSGEDLRTFRESMGIKLEEIYQVCRVSVSILRSIEENRVDDLPPTVYLRNFLKSYAHVLQLDAKKVIDGYLAHIADLEKSS
jgi:DnaJ-class molecular chaperone